MTDYGHRPDQPDPAPVWPNPDSPRWEDPQPPNPPTPPKTLILWLLIALGAFMLLCSGLAVAAITTNNNPPPPAPATAPTEQAAAPTPATTPTPTTYPIGKTFRCGDFQYTVHGVKTGVTKANREVTEGESQGVFTRIDITVKNVGTRPVYFDANNLIRAEDKAGRQFNSDPGANLAGNEGGTGWPTGINPGNQARAFAFFDMPRKTPAVRVVVSAGTLVFETDAVVLLG